MSKGDNWNTISKYHFIHLQEVLNMAATNFHTFCVSPDYVMPNSWKDSRPITDDSNCWFINSTRSCCVSTGVSYTEISCTLRNGNPMVSVQVSEGAKVVDLHIQSICYLSCHSTRSYGMNTSSSWSHPWYAGNMSKSSAWQWGDTKNCIEVGGGHIEHLL